MNRIMLFMMLISFVSIQDTYRVKEGMNEIGSSEMPVMMTAKEMRSIYPIRDMRLEAMAASHVFLQPLEKFQWPV